MPKVSETESLCRVVARLHACECSVAQRVRRFVTLWIVACQAPLSMEFQEGILEWVAMPSSRGSS